MVYGQGRREASLQGESYAGNGWREQSRREGENQMTARKQREKEMAMAKRDFAALKHAYGREGRECVID